MSEHDAGGSTDRDEPVDPKAQNDEAAAGLNDPKQKGRPEKMIGNMKEKVRDEEGG